LDEETAELATVVQRKHQIREPVQFLFQRFPKRVESLVRYRLGKFGVEYEVTRGISVPSYDHPLFRESVERGIYLGRREYLAVESELAFARRRVEDSDPFRIRPAGSPYEETARVR